MASRLVINASPYIVLAKINHAHLFQQLSDEFVMPSAVATEINAGTVQDAAKQLLSQKGVKVVSSPAPTTELASWDLGAGETAVIAYAQAHDGWTAVLDDRAARRCAVALGIPTMGTLGIILQAKQLGLIPSASLLLQQIIENDFRISEQLLRELLPKAVNEFWPPSG